jgi:hypothetical protein
MCTCVLPCLQTYKAEVLEFLRALPTAALAQLVRLPEPASLPRRRAPDRQQSSQQQQWQQQQLAAKPDKAGGAALEAASAAAASIQRLQSSKLSEAWLRTSSGAAADSDAGAVGPLTHLSQLARLCCGIASAAGDDGPADEQLPLLRPNSGPAPDKYAVAAAAADTKRHNPAAAALAAAHVANVHGPCCSSCCSAQAAPAAAALISCSCRCHPASSACAGQAAAAMLPDLETIIRLLEAASEGTWLCNPRLLQQQHLSTCSCSVCLGLISSAAATGAGKREGSSSSKRDQAHTSACLPSGAGAAAGWSPEGVMASISSGLDVLDVLGEWGVDDAALSYAVERRLVTAFHRVRGWAGCDEGVTWMHYHMHARLQTAHALLTQSAALTVAMMFQQPICICQA